MNTYFIPRNTKGEGRILYIFSIKALIYTVVGALIGFIVYWMLKMLNMGVVGIIIMIVLALLGFLIGTVKIPDSNAFELTRQAGGLAIDEIIVRYFKFKSQKKKIYVYKQEEETKDE